jgi:hypothetical protein
MGFFRSGFFRRDIEMTLKLLGVVILLGLIVLPVAWGYEQRRQARTWQSVACAYRIKEVTRQATFMAALPRSSDPCTTLARLGFQLSDEDFVILPTNRRVRDLRHGTVASTGRHAPVVSEARYGRVARTSAFASPSGPERTRTR